jgi:DNA (cytosine-5)-methyltransferase 1
VGVSSLLSEFLRPGQKLGIVGGPPCQGFSVANSRSSADDPRNSLPQLYLEIIRHLQSKFSVEFVVFENVVGLTTGKHRGVYSQFLDGMKELGFELSVQLLCASDFGVPQRRRRVVILGMSEGRVIPPINSTPAEKFTVANAIRHLPPPVYFERMLDPKSFPVHPNHWTMQPRSWRFADDVPFKPGVRSFKKLEWDRPSPTIAFGHREIFVHPDGKRRLSIFEALLLQGFPSDFVLEGTLSQQVEQVSNAVSPPMAFAIAQAIQHCISRESRTLTYNENKT